MDFSGSVCAQQHKSTAGESSTWHRKLGVYTAGRGYSAVPASAAIMRYSSAGRQMQVKNCGDLQVSCSLDSSLVLTAADEGSQVLTFGDNSLGQLGRAADRDEGQNRSSAPLWAVCDAADKPLSALSITAGLSHCIAVLASGRVTFRSLLRPA